MPLLVYNNMYEQLCEDCQTSLLQQQKTSPRKDQPKASQKYGIIPKISAGFLNQLALELKFPFQSVALLVDCAVAKKSTQFEIRISRIEECESHDYSQLNYEEDYVEVKFNAPMTNQQVVKFSESQTEGNLYSRWLKFGILGIGKTGVIVSNDGTDLKVMVFSVDDRINTSFHENSEAIYYIESLENNFIKNFGGRMMKSIIFQTFKVVHISQQKILKCPPNMTHVFIFHPRIFVMSNKVMVYEMRESNFSRDIDIYHNHQKIELLNKLGYEMSNHAEFRLSNYLSLLYKNTPMKFKISDSDDPVQFPSYLEYLRLLEKNGMVVKIQDPKIYGAVYAELYQSKTKYFAQNNGILLYSKGRLINRHGTQFGAMMDDCFFKKKYKQSAKNIWRFLGVIELNEELIKPNIIRTRFISNIFYHKFIKDIRLIVQKTDRKETDKRYPSSSIIIGDESEDNRSLRQAHLVESYEESQSKKGAKGNQDNEVKK